MLVNALGPFCWNTACKNKYIKKKIPSLILPCTSKGARVYSVANVKLRRPRELPKRRGRYPQPVRGQRVASDGHRCRPGRARTRVGCIPARHAVPPARLQDCPPTRHCYRCWQFGFRILILTKLIDFFLISRLLPARYSLFPWESQTPGRDDRWGCRRCRRGRRERGSQQTGAPHAPRTPPKTQLLHFPAFLERKAAVERSRVWCLKSPYHLTRLFFSPQTG